MKKTHSKEDPRCKIKLQEFEEFFRHLASAKKSKTLKGQAGYDPTKKELAQRFQYDPKTKKINLIEE